MTPSKLSLKHVYDRNLLCCFDLLWMAFFDVSYHVARVGILVVGRAVFAVPSELIIFIFSLIKMSPDPRTSIR